MVVIYDEGTDIGCKLWMLVSIELSIYDAEARILGVNTMAADALATCVARVSAAIVLSM